MQIRIVKLLKRLNAQTYRKLTVPARDLFHKLPSLKARGNRPLKMTFEDEFDALVYFHLMDFDSGRHLLQALKEDDFARDVIAPEGGIEKSSFFEAINNRGLEQLTALYEALSVKAAKLLPKAHAELGDLVAIDGSLIDAVLSMHWADYTGDVRKAKVHVGFNINQGIPTRVFLTEGKADEKPFASRILDKGQTGVMDRNYQCYRDFDLWQSEGKHFICRVKDNTIKRVSRVNDVAPGGIVFYDAVALLGYKRGKRTGTMTEVRIIGYRIDGKEFWVATDRHDLSAEDVAAAYKLRWNIETFFGWWKQHLKVYHLIARTEYGLKVQILGGLITYLLLAIYCHEEHGERVSINRVRELRFKIKNEMAADANPKPRRQRRYKPIMHNRCAKT